MEIFLFPPRKFAIQTWLCNCPQYLCLFHIVFEYMHSQVDRTSIGFSQIAFPTIVLPKDDRTGFAQEERLGLPYWTMILAICVVVDESKCLDTPILEFSIICEHLPCLPGYKLILRPLLVLRNPAVWR